MPPLEIVELPGLDVFEASLVGAGDNPLAKVCLVKHRRLNMAEQKKEADAKAKGPEAKTEGFDFNAFMAALPLLSPDERKMLAAALSTEPAAEVEAMNRKMEQPSHRGDPNDPEPMKPPPPLPPTPKPEEQQWAAKARDAEARAKAAEAKAAEAIAKAAALEDAAEEAAALTKARADFPSIASIESTAKMLRAADKGRPVDAAQLRALVTSYEEALKAAGLTKSRGSSLPGASTPWARAEALVAEAKAKGKTITLSDALVAIGTQNPTEYNSLQKAGE